MLTSEHTAREIEQKARKVMGMLKRGVKFTPMQPDVMTILEKTIYGYYKEKVNDQCYNYSPSPLGVTHRGFCKLLAEVKFRLCTGPEEWSGP